MSLRFTCENCHSDIIVRFLKVGDEAICRKCGASMIVPATASETGEAPDYIRGSIPQQALRTYAHGKPEPRAAPRVVPSILGPRGFGQVFREIFRVYSKNSAELFSIVAVVELPILVFTYLLGLHWFQGIKGAVVPVYGGHGAHLFLLVALVSLVGNLLVQGALIDGFSQQYVRPRIRIGRALRVGALRLGNLLVAGVLAALILIAVIMVGVGVAIAVVRAGGTHTIDSLVAAAVLTVMVLFFAARLAFFPHATVVEKASPGEAILRSWRLVRGHTLWVILITFLVLVIVALVTFIIQLVPIVGMITSVLMTPLTAAGYIVMYYDLRVRKDGYTPDALAMDIDMAAGPAPAPAEAVDPAEVEGAEIPGPGPVADDAPGGRDWMFEEDSP